MTIEQTSRARTTGHIRPARSAGRRLCGEDEYPPGLLAVAAHRLASARRMPTAPQTNTAWAVLLRAAERNRVTGLLLAAATDGALPTTPDQLRAVRTVHRAKLVRVLALEQELIAVTRLLAAEGLECRVLKGTALARLDYADPAVRSFVDMDVLVRTEHIDPVVATLATAGHVRTLAEPSPGFDRRFDKGLTMITPAGSELDVHRTFVLGPWSTRVDLAGLWDGGQALPVAGQELRALSLPNRFMHACFHATLGDWPLRLGSLRDVAEILGRQGPVRSGLRALAESWGAQAVVAAAVADTERLLGVSVGGELSDWARDHRPTRKEQAWLDLYTHPNKTFAAQAVATLRELPGWREKTAYARALARPDTRYVEGRHSSTLARFRYAVREIRRGRGRG